MRIAFRVDASAAIGSGHLRRCLALAAALREAGGESIFVIREHDEVARHVIGESSFAMRWLARPHGAPTSTARDDDPPHAPWAGTSFVHDAADTIRVLRSDTPTWMIVDHYALDARWHRLVRDGLACRTMVIDDLADRSLDVELLLDANVAADHARKYEGRLAPDTRILGGPRFALLSPAYRHALRFESPAKVESIGIFTGATDPGAGSAVVLRRCRNEAEFAGPIEIVSTSASPHLPELRAACADDPACNLLIDLPDLSGFFGRHALQIGAGGTATYERCCIGPPTILLALAENQLTVVPTLAAKGVVEAARLEGHASAGLLPDAPDLASVVQHLLGDAGARQALSARARTLVDGRGAERVATMLLRDTMRLRPARASDAGLLHGWRNHPAVRGVSQNDEEIEPTDHVRWLAKVLADENRWLFVAEIGAIPVGSIRFDRDENSCEVSLYTDPALQGLGLGRVMLALGEWHALERHGKAITVKATVVPGNETSSRLFGASGYAGGPHSFHKIIGQQKTAS